MKTLFLMRHAKSSWENADLADFDRPLNAQGEIEATFIGETIRQQKFQIDLIISSPAERAKQTAFLIKKHAQITSEIVFDDKIYEASPHALLRIVSELNEDKNFVLLIGHNPGFENLIKILTGKIEPMPTATLAVINLQIGNWSETTAGCGQLEIKISPPEKIKVSGAA